MRAEAAQLPALALPSPWPVCLRATPLLRVASVRLEEVDQAGWLMYRLHGMYVAVLSAHMGAEVAARREVGAGPLVFAIARRRPPDARRGYPWGQLDAAHIPRPANDAIGFARRPATGVAVGGVVCDGSRAVGRLRWLLGQGHVTYVELAQDSKAHAERALPAPSNHRLRGVTLPLRNRCQVLKMALDALH